MLDLQENAWQPLPAAPSEFGEARCPRAYRVYLDGKHLVVVSPQMRAATVALGDSSWTAVRGYAPAFNGFLPNFVLDDARTVIHVGCSFPGGAVPTRQCLLTGWMARVNVDVPRWEAGHFPERDAPPSVVGAWTLWTGDRLIEWGGFEVLFDPDGRNSCEGVRRPCDPVYAHQVGVSS